MEAFIMKLLEGFELETNTNGINLPDGFELESEQKTYQFTPEEMDQIKQKAFEINKQLGVVNDDGSTKGSWVENGWVRKPVAVMQGISNANLNPAGYVARAFGMDTKPLQARDALERGLERGAGQAFDYATMAVGGNALGASGALGQGVKVPSKVARWALMQAPADAAVTGAGGGLLAGAINTSDPTLDFALNVLGGSAANAIQGGLKSGFKSVKQMKAQPKEITDESFLTAMGDKNSVRRMKNAIQSGNTDLQTRAGSFYQKMSDYKASKGHADIPFAQEGSGQLKEAITLPEFKQAKASYDAFKTAHSGEKIASKTMADFYKNHPIAKRTMVDLQKNVPSVNKTNANTIGSVDKLKSQLSRIARGSGDNAGYAEAAAGDLRSIIENSSKGFKKVNKAYAKAINHQKNYENLLFTNAKQVSNATPSPISQLTGLGVGGTLGAGIYTGNPYLVASGLGMAGLRETNKALRRQAGDAVARGATPLIDLIKDSALEYGLIAPQRAGLQAIIEKALNSSRKGE